MAYAQTDLTNQQIAVAEAQLATVTANNALATHIARKGFNVRVQGEGNVAMIYAQNTNN